MNIFVVFVYVFISLLYLCCLNAEIYFWCNAESILGTHLEKVESQDSSGNIVNGEMNGSALIL